MHIIDPEQYPLSPTAIYRPSKFTISQAVSFEESIGASNIVIVQPSIYENDNSCLLDALKVLNNPPPPTTNTTTTTTTTGGGRGGCARGVVSFDPETTPLTTLQEWHQLGVRGVRINLQSTAKTMAHAEMKTVVRRYADAVRPLGWVIQLYIPLDLVTALEPLVPTLGGVRIIIDHLGSPNFLTSPSPSPSPSTLLSPPPSPCPPQKGAKEEEEEEEGKGKGGPDPYRLDGFASLVRLLQSGHTYVKMSAPYRLGKREEYLTDVQPFAREIIRVAGRSRVVFASDWPHTRFEGLNIQPWIQQVMDWCEGDRELEERIFRSNAEELWA